MAYANLINQSVANKNELFCRLRDFICKRNGTYDYSATGIGWTLHDSSYATDEDNCAINDWFVIYSPGEGGEDDLYFKVTWTNGYIQVAGYQSWNASTHAGSSNTYSASSNNLTMAETTVGPFWIYGDLDSLLLVSYASATGYRSCVFGKLLPGYSDIVGTIATCGTTLSAGSDISIVCDAVPAEWEVGRHVYIRTTHNNNTATVKCEKIVIKTLVGNTITADLTNAYTTGSKLSDMVGYHCQASLGFGVGQAMVDAASSIGSATTIFYNTMTESYLDPESYENRYSMIPISTMTANGFLGYIKNVKRVPSFGTSPMLTHLDVLEEWDGTEWRCFTVYSNYSICVKEV